MSSLLSLMQGSPEWHEHRRKYRNASETPAVLGVSPWTSPYDLWLIKTGRKSQEENEAMKYGSAMEPAARNAYEALTGNIMQPKVMINGLYSASLDGITLEGHMLLEIKCPFQGNHSELWAQVKQGIVPEHYRLQVQHQLMVSGCSIAHLWVFDGLEGVNLSIRPDLGTFEQIRSAWDRFQQNLDSDTPPPLTEQDTVLREDNTWAEVAGLYVSLKAHADKAAKEADEAKARLVALTQHNRESGYGVAVTRFYKQGNKEEVRVTISREVEQCY